MWKKVLWTILLVVIVIIGSGYWFFGLVEKHPDIAALKATQPDQLEYLKHAVDIKRGRILIVVTSTNKMGDTDKYTGYELTELSRAYYIFEVNGFAVDIASPLGGRPPVVIDNDDMGELDYAFLNDELAQNKVRYSLALSTVDPDNYAAVYFVGGKGAMFDFPDNQAIQQLVQNYAEQGKVIGAVCHGPAALVNVSLSNGEPMLQGREVVSFTNAEELFLIPEAATIFPFLLESKLQQQGARFNGGPNYLEQVVVDNKLVTGQNPWSVWLLAESMIQALGYEPVLRQLDRQEHSVKLLQIYHDYGFEMTATELNLMLNSAKQYPDRNLILMHGIVGVMQGDFGKAIDLVRLAHRVKNWSSS